MGGPRLLNAVKDIDRLRQITMVLSRHGFGEFLRKMGLGNFIDRKKSEEEKGSFGVRLRRTLEELGPTFVKLGQILSTRPDVFSNDVISELKKLQDAVPPLPFSEIRPFVEAELGESIDELFVSFEEKPLASASISQVHAAVIETDAGPEDVVVKVQRPQVKHLMELDIDLLYWGAHLLERSIPEARLFAPVKLVTEFDQSTRAELDFLSEAENAERFLRNFEGKRHIRFPEVHRKLTTRHVLTLERLRGKRIECAIEDGMSGKAIAKTAIDVLIQQIFEDGFFHADPHPGNLFIDGAPESPVIAMFDLGLVGRLSPKLRDKTIDLMVAAVREDHHGIADALWAIGRPTKKVDREAYEAEVAMLAERYLGKALGEIEFSALIKDLVGGARRYGIEIPAGFLMMGKAMMTIEGIGKEIYPELDLFEEVKPYFLRLVQVRYSPEKVTQDVVRGLTRIGRATSEAPLQLEEILEDLRKGAFQLSVRDVSVRTAADTLGRRIFSGMVVASSLMSGALLLASGAKWLGFAFSAFGLTYALGHMVLMFFLTRLRK